MTIPAFPEFVSLTSISKDHFKRLSQQEVAYSDFNYTNLLVWDENQQTKVSSIGQGLIIVKPSYTGQGQTISIAGPGFTTENLQIILNHFPGSASLSMVPESAIARFVNEKNLKIEHDNDNFDCVLDLNRLLIMDGHEYRQMRRGYRTFRKQFGPGASLVMLNVRKLSSKHKVKRVTRTRMSNRQTKDMGIEYRALKRLFSLHDLRGINCIGLRVGRKVIAYLIYEDITSTMSLAHFWKADTKYKGVYQYFMVELAKHLVANGKTHINIEQDLGLPNLRYAKRAFAPEYLKKYEISFSDKISPQGEVA